MSYTREQRAANAAKAAASANEAAAITPEPDLTQVEAMPDDAPVSKQTPEEEPPAPLLHKDERTRVMEEVVARQAKHAEDKRDEPVPETTPEPEAPVEPAPVAPVVAEAPKTVKQTVDGKEYDAPLSEIEESGGERAWRIERAAKNRLEENKAALAETRRVQAETAAMLQAIQKQSQPPPAPRPTVAQLINAIRTGDDAQAAAAGEELVTLSRGQQIDPQEIVMQSTAIASYNAARKRFATEFNDLTSNPIIANTLVNMENQRVQGFKQNGQVNWANLSNVDFDDFFRRIGNEVRSAFGRQSQPPSQAPAAPTSSPPSSPSAREERKASIVNLPTASARAELPAEEKPETNAQIVASMRKARGFPTG